WLGQLLCPLDVLAGVRLKVVGIHTPGRSKDDLLDTRFDRFRKNQSVKEEVRGGAGLVQVHVTPSAVIGGQMEDELGAAHGRADDAGLAQVSLDEVKLTVPQVRLHVFQASARQVIDDAD